MSALFIGLFGSLITVVGAILKDQWSKRGTVKTSEASELWANMKSELERLTQETIRYRAEITVSYQEMAALRSSSEELRITIKHLETNLAACILKEKQLRTKLKRKGIDT